MPCIPEHPSGPWKRAARCACRYRAERLRLHPVQYISPRPRPASTRPHSDTYNGEIVKRPCLLNVLQRLLQIAQFLVDQALRFLGALHSLGLKGLDGLDLSVHIVRLGLERAEALLDLVDDGRVLEYRAVVSEVDLLRLLLQYVDFAARVVVALLERLERGSSLAAQTELRANLCPVELEGGGALRWGAMLVFVILKFGGLPLGTQQRIRCSNGAVWSSCGYGRVWGTYSNGHCDELGRVEWGGDRDRS